MPDIAAAMGRVDAAGIDVARILTDAHRAGGVDQAVAAVTKGRCPGAGRRPVGGARPTGPRPRRWPRPRCPRTCGARHGPASATGAPAAAPRVRGTVDPWAAPAPASTDVKRVWGPLTEGLDVLRDLDLGSRLRALVLPAPGLSGGRPLPLHQHPAAAAPDTPAAVPAHRRQAAPAKTAGRGR
ncbi:hypothetical protein [Streptomyces virginiae]|uniref:Uncharacterized protein n=1 Tax=Streptomyces virginiae TaxID=1961 RepID=A0ABZ1TR49_STRVG|nr:hypothetical protein [Streptomyces virginiae]